MRSFSGSKRRTLPDLGIGRHLLSPGAITADVTHTLRNVRHRIVPIGFVLDGNVAGEALLFEFVENPLDVRYAGAENRVRQTLADGGAFLQMQADDAAAQNSHTVQRFEA